MIPRRVSLGASVALGLGLLARGVTTTELSRSDVEALKARKTPTSLVLEPGPVQIVEVPKVTTVTVLARTIIREQVPASATTTNSTTSTSTSSTTTTTRNCLLGRRICP